MRAKILFCMIIIAAAASMILVGYTLKVQAAEKKEIVFGGSLGLSGQWAELGRLMKDGFEVWFEDINSTGGIYVKEYGRKLPVKWILYDDQSNTANGAKLYEKLITYDNVDFVTAPFSSGITFASSTVVEKYKKIMVSVCGSSDDIYTRGFDYIFNHIVLGSKHWDSNVDLIDKVLKPRPKRIAIATDKKLANLTNAEAIRRKLQDRGFEIVLYEEFPDDIKDASTIINRVKARDADIFFGITGPPSCALFTKQMKTLNCRPKMINLNEGPEMEWYVPQFGKDAEGICARYASYASPDSPKYIAFSKRIKEKDRTWPRSLADPVYHAGGYDSLEMIRIAIEGTGTLNNTEIAKYFRTHVLENMITGLGNKAKFEDYDKYKNINVSLVPAATQVQNGKIMVIWPEQFAQSKVWYPLGPWTK